LATTEAAPNVQPSQLKRQDRLPVTCQRYQCLFCLLNDLPPEDREKDYASKYSLQRHVDRCRLSQFGEQESISCPDEFFCAGEVFNGKSHFKNHAARVHLFVL